MTTFRYLSASDWGMWWDTTNPRPERQPDPECYIHHVGGAAWMDGDAAAIFRELNAYAINVKGYDALDYDLLVHYDRTRDILTIGEGRGEFMSAATRNRNEQGEAIVLCGNTHLREPHPAELEGLARAVVIGIEHGWIARTAQILGHRDNLAYPDGQPTACPGQYLYARLGDIRNRVAELLAPTSSLPEEDLMIAAVCKPTSGAHLAQLSFRGPILKMGETADHDISTAEVFGRGGGKAWDVASGEVKSWSPDSGGSWASVKARLTANQARARMSG